MKKAQPQSNLQKRSATLKYARCLIIGLLPALFSLQLAAQNPTISYSSPKTYVAGTAIPTLTPTSSGVATLANSTTPIVLGTGLSSPKGIGMDSKGDIYVADYSNNAIKEIPFATNNTVTISDSEITKRYNFLFG